MQPQDTNPTEPQTTPTTAEPTPQVVVGGQQPSAVGSSSPEPTPTTDAGSGAGSSSKSTIVAGGGNNSRKKLIVLGAVLVLAIALPAAFYFGYYKNPSVMLGQSMVNTGKGYDKLVSYVDEQTLAKHKSVAIDGSFSMKSSGSSVDGNISTKGDDKNLEATFDVGAAGVRVNGEVRAIAAANSTYPDIYLKASGIKGLGALTGSAELGAVVDGLDGKWIAIDHTLTDSLAPVATQTSTDKAVPTKEQIIDEARAFGTVNQQYVFTNDQDKSIAKITKKIGTETIDGHKTYHYQMTLDKANVKAYIAAQQAALKSSKLNAWIKDNDYQSGIEEAFKSAIKSADEIDSKDTFDLWIDTESRLLYKVRLPEDTNSATNYIDFGLGYKGGADYPLFIAASTKEGKTDTKGSLNAVLHTDTNKVDLKFALTTTGDDAVNASAKLTYKPSNEAIKVTAPAGAIPATQIIEQLGLTPLLAAYAQQAQSAAAAAKASN